MVTEDELKKMVEDSDAEIKKDLKGGDGLSYGDNETESDDSGGTKNHHEEREQKTLAAWLDAKGLQWCHVPNENNHHVAYRMKLKKQGVKPGIPDVLIFDSPPEGDYDGVAIELKRPDGYPSDVTDSQQEWLDALEGCGWLTEVCFGADEAISFIKDFGYGG